MRDGGAGADPDNKELVAAPPANPQPADTTLWPGRAPAPVDRLAAGEMPPPVAISASPAPATVGGRPVTPDVPATAAEQRTFDGGGRADPRKPDE